MVYLLKNVIFHGKPLNNQMVNMVIFHCEVINRRYTQCPALSERLSDLQTPGFALAIAHPKRSNRQIRQVFFF
jgi:hypothetical protein